MEIITIWVLAFLFMYDAPDKPHLKPTYRVYSTLGECRSNMVGRTASCTSRKIVVSSSLYHKEELKWGVRTDHTSISPSPGVAVGTDSSVTEPDRCKRRWNCTVGHECMCSYIPEGQTWGTASEALKGE